MAAAKNYHKPIGLKQHKCIILYVCRIESDTGLTELKPGSQENIIHFWKGEPVSLLFSACRSCRRSMAPSPIPPSKAAASFLITSITSHHNDCFCHCVSFADSGSPASDTCVSLPLLRTPVITVAPLDNPGYSPYLKVSSFPI